MIELKWKRWHKQKQKAKAGERTLTLSFLYKMRTYLNDTSWQATYLRNKNSILSLFPDCLKENGITTCRTEELRSCLEEGVNP